MFFTRTIRRKLLSGLALVLGMLLTLSLGGISGLSSYRRVVKDLEVGLTKAPRRADLVSALVLLTEPLLPAARGDRAPRRKEFDARLADARQRLADYRWKEDHLPPTPGALARRPVADPLLDQIDLGLTQLQERHTAVTDTEWPQQAQWMLAHVVHLQNVAQRVPNAQEGLDRTLDQARRDYMSGLWLISVTGAVSFGLFLGLVWYGYASVFSPIQQLHQGALRVAQGDFDYRLRPKTKDEMAELADAFNKMTSRFQEIARDLDAQVRERSKQLVRSERLAGVGFLAAGVAHEINNPLSAIAMAAESLESRAAEQQAPESEDAAVARQYLGMIQREAFRCQQITTRLLDFSRAQDSTRSEQDVTAIVRDVVDMIGHMSKFRGRTIEFSHTSRCSLEINGAEIKQVVLNLVANGLESMDVGGRLTIGISELTDRVTISFIDEGCGMTPEVIENLFEPFFTRNRTGKGTGLGLSITHRIVSDHGGSIEVTSPGPRLGSTFRVHLPRRATAQRGAA